MGDECTALAIESPQGTLVRKLLENPGNEEATNHLNKKLDWKMGIEVFKVDYFTSCLLLGSGYGPDMDGLASARALYEPLTQTLVKCESNTYPDEEGSLYDFQATCRGCKEEYERIIKYMSKKEREKSIHRFAAPLEFLVDAKELERTGKASNEIKRALTPPRIIVPTQPSQERYRRRSRLGFPESISSRAPSRP